MTSPGGGKPALPLVGGFETLKSDQAPSPMRSARLRPLEPLKPLPSVPSAPRVPAPVGGVGATATAESPSVVLGEWRARRYGIKLAPEPTFMLQYEESGSRKKRVTVVRLKDIDKVCGDVGKLTEKVIRCFPKELKASSVKVQQVRRLLAKLVGAKEDITDNDDTHRAGRTHSSSEMPSSGGASARVQSSDAGAPDQRRSSDVGAPFHIQSSEGGAPGHIPQPCQQAPRALPALHLPPSPRISAKEGKAGAKSAYTGLNSIEDALEDLESMLGSGSLGFDTSSHSPSVASPTFSVRDYSIAGSMCIDSPGGSMSGGGGDMVSSRSCDTLTGGGAGSSWGTDMAGSCRSSAPSQGDDEVLELQVDLQGDLNKVTAAELAMAKQQMDEHFQKHRLKPGDPGFVYDKQVEFGPPTGENEWDEDEDEDDGYDEDKEGMERSSEGDSPSDMGFRSPNQPICCC